MDIVAIPIQYISTLPFETSSPMVFMAVDLSGFKNLTSQLWMKNEVFGESFEYVGENKFEYGGMPSGLYERLHFNFQKDGTINLKFTSLWEKGNKINKVFTKV